MYRKNKVQLQKEITMAEKASEEPDARKRDEHSHVAKRNAVKNGGNGNPAYTLTSVELDAPEATLRVSHNPETDSWHEV